MELNQNNPLLQQKIDVVFESHIFTNTLIKKMRTSFKNELVSEPIKNIDIVMKFNEWYAQFGYNKVIPDNIHTMSCKLITTNGTITMHILHDSSDIHMIHTLINTITMFCDMFKHDYNGLTIYVYLNDDQRIRGDLVPNTSKYYCGKDIKCHQEKQLAFCVGGTTVTKTHSIYLTRREDILKLTIHELCHYAGFDDNLRGILMPSTWSTETDFNVSEVYTEFLAVIIHTCLISVMTNEPFNDLIKNEINYSVYLSASILNFYDYNGTSLHEFFTKTKKNKQPIYLWEYILLRTSLMINLTDVFNVINDMHIDSDLLMNLLKTDLESPIRLFIDSNFVPSISYINNTIF